MAAGWAPSRRSALLWAAAAAATAVAAHLLALRTPITIVIEPGRVVFSVAGTAVVAETTIGAVEGLEISAADSIAPPGGGELVIRRPEGEPEIHPLPRRFAIPPTRVTAVGDWFIDRRVGRTTVHRSYIRPTRRLAVETVLLGRHQSATTFTFRAWRPLVCHFRRGLLDNDLTVLDEQGGTLANATIAPRGWQRGLAALATALTGAALGAALLAAFTLLGDRARRRPPDPEGRDVPGAATAVVAVLLAGAAVALSAWVAVDVLQRLPHQPDSVAYLLQARWLTEGRLSGPAEARVTVPFSFVHHGRWLIQYPIGWPVILAVGLAAGAPHLVAPALGGLYILALVLLGRELFCTRTAVLAALLAVLSPMARVMFASHLSHPASATLIVLSLWLFVAGRRRRSRWWAGAAGLSLGLAFAVRPLPAVAAALPMAAVLALDLARRRRAAPGLTIAQAAGGLIGTLPVLIANHLLTGHPLRFAYTLVSADLWGPANLAAGVRNLDALLTTTAASVFGWGWPHLPGPWLVAAALALPLVPILAGPRRGDLFLAALMAAVAAIHLGSEWNGLHGYGPRYWFEAFAALYLLAARGFTVLAGRGRASTAAAWALLLLLTATSAASLPQRLELYRGYNFVSDDLERALTAHGIDRGLVVFNDWQWFTWGRAGRLMATGSEVEFAAYGHDLEDLVATVGRSPTRPIYLWRQGELIPLAGPQPSTSSTSSSTIP